MPELPEVETIKNDLLPLVVGRTIEGIELIESSIVSTPRPDEFLRRIIGRTVTGLERRGKYLIFRLDKGYLIMHMRMTGSLLAVPAGSDATEAVRGARVRAILDLDNDTHLYFFDRRGLGKMWAVGDKEEVVGRLGPEPLQPDFTPDVLKGILALHRSPVKAVLTDQQAIAGIGNMYADEALFEARINPITPASKLSAEQVGRLYVAIRQVLQSGIAGRGASVDTYFRPGGGLGQAHLKFKVAHRFRKPCPVCGTPIERVMVRNRGSYFCPHCQPLIKYTLEEGDSAPRKVVQKRLKTHRVVVQSNQP
ncbi:MAG: bifunctional DNA-formamidopyrimidine glycosylase/DNA-(apurinic or apyrimidinic site) lyase [Chloroflexi bacterium]|nr:bifunctional DNA-formamidopyrimidine glycosylase/DNA-(apurinic or apyrimidinic site) lyase [Chloroflexota bacterium]